MLLALAAPAADAAPGLSFTVSTREATFGRAIAAHGTLADAGSALPGEPVVLEGQRKFVGSWRRLATTTTDATGDYSFAPKLDRNYRLRAVAQPLHVSSRVLRVYTFPAVSLTFQAVRQGFVRLIQRYTVPRDVKLTTPTIFYLGPRSAKVSSLHEKAPTRRVRAGRYRSRVTVALPSAWSGRFRFGSCFHTTHGSGLGKPDAHCPAKFRF
jgi:hypothetical protein